MHKSLALSAILALLLWGCSDDVANNICLDEDGDGYGVGAACQGSDCDDSNPDCNEGDCCPSVDCVDEDNDGYGEGADCEGPDCNDSNPDCHEGACCTAIDCVDEDNDGYGEGTDCDGPDCNDGNPDCHEGACCTAIDCVDEDNDGYGEGTDCDGPDCNDGNPDCHEGACCTAIDCIDEDNDGYGEGTDCTGTDCNDADVDNWTSCDTCLDNDGDGHFAGCDAYTGIDGPDCDDADENNWASCDTCLDADGDGHYAGCDAYTSIDGPDCDDADENNWASCDTCLDADGDGHYVGCDAYTDIDGPDCDDADESNWASCDTCLDADGDGHYAGCDAYTSIDGPDCDDADENNWASCDTCLDGDGDGHFAGCDAYTSIDGPDCDDFDENNWISCSDCVDSDGDSAYVACDAYTSIDGPDCDDFDDTSYPGATEVCDGNDNDCSGSVDASETDDDGDHYVECNGWDDTQHDDTAVTAGGDCDDSTDLAYPGNDPEICGDGIDNNCDGMTDLEDSATCPTILVTIWNNGDPEEARHGRTIMVSAGISPPDPNGTEPWAWIRDWQVVDAQPSPQCAIADVVMVNSGGGDDNTFQRFTMPDDISKLDCIYTVEISVNGYATATHRLQVVNHAPVITDVLGATFDGSIWRMNVPVGVQLTMQVLAAEQDGDTPLHFDWSGADVDQLQCAAGAGCDSSDASFPYQSIEDWVFPSIYRASPYQLTVSVYDDFDSSDVTTADIEVTVENCVWVEAGGGDGVGTLAAPRNTIAGALLQAAFAPGTNVCIIGAGTFTEDIRLPASPNAPDLLGGFDTSGIFSTDRPIIQVADTAGLQFETDGANRLYHLQIEQGTDDGATVSIVDASPALDDCIIMIPDGSTPRGVIIRASDGQQAQPILNGCAIIRNWNDPDIDSATGLAVLRGGTGIAAPTLLDSSVTVYNCTGTCRAVHVNAGTSANILNNDNIQAGSDNGQAIGIDVTGSFGQTASAYIEGNNQINADSDGTRSIAVNLFLTQDVVIQNNRWVGTPWMNAGREFSVGIADGVVLRDGSTSPGRSDGLIIRGNEMISGGANWFWTDCSGLGDTGEGVDISAGILLVGSRNASIADNGRPNDEFAGIFGGSSTVHWVPERRRLAPSSVGLWLIDTHDVTVTDNEIRAGSYNMFEGCPDPSRPDFSPEIPVATAYRDGLPPNDEYLFGPAPGELPSHGTVFARNGASCALPPENGAMGGGIVTWCAAAELNVPESDSAPFLVNNHLAATKGNMLIALWQNGGGGVVAINNTFDSDLMLQPWDPPPFPDSIRKWAVLAEGIAPDGLTLINNIFNVHRDDPYDIASERLGLYERVISSSGSADSNIMILDSNLFYIEGDDLGDPTNPVYARIDSGLGVAEYAAVDINAIVGISSIFGNFVDLPGLSTVTKDWAKSTVRLQAGSAAIDSGSTAAEVPFDDIDRERRPDPSGGVDIGHDEYYP
ncbi:MAG: hypothetical protein JRF33_00575 [Deltaproteobacteria bacterium]|nr:hypothetical protein [Deltaproteobacteria bacterium]